MEKLLELGNWVTIGATDAVVTNIYDNTNAEVIYLDKGRSINQDIVLQDGQWVFKHDLGGGYADNYSRLKQYTNILKRGRC